MQITSEMTTRMTTTTSRNTRTPAAQSGVIHFDAIQNLVKKYVVFKNGMHFVARIKEFKAAETKGVQVSMAIKNAALSFVSYFTRTARAAQRRRGV
jgi:shikimate 5-dehydrogenase